MRLDRKSQLDDEEVGAKIRGLRKEMIHLDKDELISIRCSDPDDFKKEAALRMLNVIQAWERAANVEVLDSRGEIPKKLPILYPPVNPQDRLAMFYYRDALIDRHLRNMFGHEGVEWFCSTDELNIPDLIEAIVKTHKLPQSETDKAIGLVRSECNPDEQVRHIRLIARQREALLAVLADNPWPIHERTGIERILHVCSDMPYVANNNSQTYKRNPRVVPPKAGLGYNRA